MQAINLLPADLVAAAHPKPRLALFLSGAVPLISVCLVTIGYAQSHSSLSTKRADLASVQAQIAELSPATLAPSADENLIAERTARMTALGDAMAKAVPWDTLFVDIARVLPTNVWLTSLSVSSPTPANSSAAATASPNGFVIQGTTYSQRSVAILLQRLQLLPSLSNVALQSTASADGVGAKVLVQFTIDGVVQAPQTGATT
jgi:Tfp pilus assembly protein PilN